MEFFIVGEGKMWNSILKVLEEKAAAGVDVRFIYDDFGLCIPASARLQSDSGIQRYQELCVSIHLFHYGR